MRVAPWIAYLMSVCAMNFTQAREIPTRCLKKCTPTGGTGKGVRHDSQERRNLLKSVADFAAERQRRNYPSDSFCVHAQFASKPTRPNLVSRSGRYYGLPMPWTYSGGTESAASIHGPLRRWSEPGSNSKDN